MSDRVTYTCENCGATFEDGPDVCDYDCGVCGQWNLLKDGEWVTRGQARGPLPTFDEVQAKRLSPATLDNVIARIAIKEAENAVLARANDEMRAQIKASRAVIAALDHVQLLLDTSRNPDLMMTRG